MALILDETFATMIPAGFATLRSQSGSPTASYNASAQAVDLVNTVLASAVWDITSLSATPCGELEIDLELVADNSGSNNIRHAGVWCFSGDSNLSNGYRLCHYLSQWYLDHWTGSSLWSGQSVDMSPTQLSTEVFNTVGDRRTINLRWDMSSGSGTEHLSVEGRVGGAMRWYGTYPFAALRPGVFFYAASVRLHSIKVWDAPQAALALIGKYAPNPGSGMLSTQPTGPVTPVSHNERIAVHPYYWNGPGTLSGTVKVTPNSPVHRKVRLINEATGQIVRETWSDETTGAYSFTGLDMTAKYTVMSYDYRHEYRAVVSDNLTAV